METPAAKAEIDFHFPGAQIGIRIPIWQARRNTSTLTHLERGKYRIDPVFPPMLPEGVAVLARPFLRISVALVVVGWWTW